MAGNTTETIRLARPDEATLVRELSAEAYIPAGRVWLLVRDGMPAAVLVLEPGPEHLMVYSVAVHPAHQGQGMARRLLAFAAERAVALGVRELRLYTNPRMERNVALYRACGFRETGRRPHPSRPGEFLVDMAKAVGTGSPIGRTIGDGGKGGSPCADR